MTAETGRRVTLVLKNCRLLNVYSGAIEETDISIAGDRIVSIDPVADTGAADVIDCTGKIAAPGLIDAHMHVDTTFLWPGELARVLVPLGTTSVFVDTTNNAHTGGAAAVTALRDAFAGLPLRGFISAPSYCPIDAALGTAAADLDAASITALLEDGCLAIGETIWTRMALDDRDYMRLVRSCHAAGLRVSGHGGEIRRGDEAAYDAYTAAGVQDDHCISVGADILPRLRRGLKLFFVECTGRRGQLRPLVDEMIARRLPWRQVCLCVDNNTAIDIVTNGYGYVDYLLRIALDAGVPPVEAWRTVTLNGAEHFRMSSEIGAIAPGRLADILLLSDLDAFPPEKVFVGGRFVAERGRLVVDIPAPAFPPAYRNTIRLERVARDALSCPAESTNVRVQAFRAHDGDAFNTRFVHELAVRDGEIQPDLAGDVLKIAVIERFGRNGGAGIGFVRGFGLKRGAIATSISVPFNAIVAVGTSDAEIWAAIEALAGMQGGFVAVADGAVVGSAALRLGGIMSELPYERFLADLAAAEKVVAGLGCTLANPFKTLVSTTHATLPDLGLTDKGLIDSRRGVAVPLVLAEAGHAVA